ncbi:type III-B CRISPR module-associated protein Cmr3 [uncultured Microscilla sp.]|uniref:type III-B CRISPR module-associated protein Cmr3 n=1 Tax=uncultured Microscilla sp. TaxID=432653 RepID=UPI00262BF374|nr:type III-B CRISPR module-associated protein Cmr3 [uncultured Microscilla sp.]
MKIKIDALDTLFFRDGKPFSLGEETWAEGLFPPSPGVLYGALRSLYFSLHPHEMDKAGQDNDPTKELIIKGIYFFMEDEWHLVNPLDYVKEKKAYRPRFHLLCLKDLPQEIKGTSYPLSSGLVPPKNIQVENVEGMISLDALEDYAMLNEASGEIKPWARYVHVEPKVGIGRSKITNSTREGLLYRVGMVRPAFDPVKEGEAPNVDATFERLSIIIDFEGLPAMDHLPAKGFFRLGGESKAVAYEVFEPTINLPSQAIEGQGIFKLVLLTPALFDNGWCPASINPTTGRGTLTIAPQKMVEVELLAAATGKPVPVGGFDMQAKLPKPMLKAVPAGAVYYFRLANAEDAPLLQQKFSPASLSDQRANEGFGLALFIHTKNSPQP